jgi:carbon storage regulator CsrA
MLILTRRPNETLKIGDNVTVRILQVHGNQVRSRQHRRTGRNIKGLH